MKWIFFIISLIHLFANSVKGNETNNIVYIFDIGFCSLEFLGFQGKIRIPLLDIQIFYDRLLDKFICTVENRVYHDQLNIISFGNSNSFLCQHRSGPMKIEKLFIINYATVLCNGNYSKNIVTNTTNLLFTTINRIESFSGFNLPIINMIINITKSYKLISTMYSDQFLSSILSALDDLKDFEATQFDSYDHLNVEVHQMKGNSKIVTIFDQSLYIRLVENMPVVFHTLLVPNVTKDVSYLLISIRNSSQPILFEVIIKRKSSDEIIECDIWYKKGKDPSEIECLVTNVADQWVSCQCNRTGVLIIKKSDFISMSQRDKFNFDLFPPNLTGVPRTINYEFRSLIEDVYRYERVTNMLNLAVMVLAMFNIILILIMMLYYRIHWPSVSYSNRQYVVLLLLLWLNFLILPAFVMRIIRTFVLLPAPNTEYLATGLIMIHSAFAYTLMLGGIQIVLFVFVTNLRIWTYRFFDTFHCLIIACCIGIPFPIMFFSFVTIIVSIHKINFIPIAYGTFTFVIAPSLLVLIISFILTGISIFFPGRGGGTVVMLATYPLIILQLVNFYHVMKVKNIFAFEHEKLFYHTCGMFIQVTYQSLWFIIMVILPVKNITLFGKRDAPFRHEYIYLIRFQNQKEFVIPSSSSASWDI
uniref:GCR138 n=1 Tax=Schmidtea mediterranea TaxID=79327 RepID=A0A193KUQ0_SCHMD|nr:GCR138 [Schmidtea mediterranea]